MQYSQQKNCFKTIGVVIPIYNVEKYLKECLDSVINQTYTNLEIILVNDGSTDENSLNIAKEYTLKDKRITLFDKKNGGLSSARNVGIEYFSGEYKLKNKTQTIKENSLIEFNIEGNNPYEIYTVYKSYKAFNNEQDLTSFTYPSIDYIIFLDSDDYWELNCIEECVPRMDGVDVLWFDYQMFEDETKKEVIYSRIDNFKFHQSMVITPFQWLKQFQATKQKDFSFGWHGMINFRYLQSIKLKFLDSMYWEDVYFGVVLFMNSQYIYVFPKKCIFNRMRNNFIGMYKNFSNNTLPCYLQDKYGKYFTTIDEIIEYHGRISRVQSVLEIVNFIQNLDHSRLKTLAKEALFDFLYEWSNVIFFTKKDPINYYLQTPLLNKRLFYKDQVKQLRDASVKYIVEFIKDAVIERQKLLLEYTNKKDVIYKDNLVGAKERIQNQLSYKLGQTMIVNSKSVFGIISMPIFILSTILSYKQNQKIYQEKIKKNPKSKLPPLHLYQDYNEALKCKNHLSYKLGQTLIQANKTWYKGGYVKMLFEIRKLKGKI
ncbi:glycosyltransferase [Campylobacter lari]|nr:glycosyltransferase [Campylobacter lari]